MKAITTVKILQVVFAILLLTNLSSKCLAQTIIVMKPKVLAAAVAGKFFGSFDDANPVNATVSKIDSVICNGKTIGYVFYYKPKGFAVVPKIREINPYFALSAVRPDKSGDEKSNETFLREELIERYITVTNKNIPAISVQRSEKLWQQLLASASN